jgi:hypothetical protein
MLDCSKLASGRYAMRSVQSATCPGIIFSNIAATWGQAEAEEGGGAEAEAEAKAEAKTKSRWLEMRRRRSHALPA